MLICYFCVTKISKISEILFRTSTQQLNYQQQQQQQFYKQISKTSRSKSVEDFTTDILFETNRLNRNSVRNNTNLINGMSQSSYALNKRALPAALTNPHQLKNGNHQMQVQHKHLQRNQLRYSVDNLLEIDTSYYNNNLNFNHHHKVRKFNLFVDFI